MHYNNRNDITGFKQVLADLRHCSYSVTRHTKRSVVYGKAVTRSAELLRATETICDLTSSHIQSAQSCPALRLFVPPCDGDED
ncbi:hypothetical protein VTN00DRAFT_1438 [Thermoascus crustaceus]|uniref:uncharacterized protein n=1 Tax=Thermoascus crustaceus TaxID=5088 RepID=UPI003743A40C